MRIKKNQLAVVVIALIAVVGIGYLYLTQYYFPGYAVKLEELQTLKIALNSEPRGP